MNIFIFCILLFVPMFFTMVINKYRLIRTEEGINKLYEYSKYLIFKTENLEELQRNKDFNKFKNYLKRNNRVFLVIHTNSKIIKADKLDSLSEDKFNKFFKGLENTLKNKDLKISIFNLKDSIPEEKDFFWSLLNYKSFEFLKYITLSNLTYFFGISIGILLMLFNILSQKTLYILGIPTQLSLVNLFDFGQFILYDILSSLGVIIYFLILVLSLGSIIIWGIIYFYRNRKDKLGNKSFLDHILFTTLVASLMSPIFIILILISSTLVSISKMNFQDSKIKYEDIFTIIGDYIDYTGYPRIGVINGDSKYIVGYDTHSIYFYDLKEINNKFLDFENTEKNNNLVDTCNLILKYKNNSTRLNILLLKNKYLKPEYFKSILRKNVVITNERPLSSSDIIIEDIDKKCQTYIEKYK
ncbi:hypothetical protein [Arcobacter vandammei]|uniref:hypothetical protein n=1 Tax=Arcobacter vandammei TaxID=2782243 RepID=UPI0018DF2754|nr:hypothetical protein [Arcobacter vandammei]